MPDTLPKKMPIILGDWGTTCLRLYLCAVDRHGVPETKGFVEGPGVKYVSDFQEAFLDSMSKLPRHAADTDVILAGMAGSNIGWRETSYVSCPLNWLDVLRNVVSFSVDEHGVTILPGASCVNRFGYYDVMRGEETQLLGVSGIASLDRSRRLVCLPGTHTKWATIDADGLERFSTTLQGELFDLLQRHSVLVPRDDPGNSPPRSFTRPTNDSVFDTAVDLIRLNRKLGLIQALFSTRSRMLAGELTADDASSYLSGILIGADIRDVGLSILSAEDIGQPVLLVGDEVLTQLYAEAMTRYGIDSRQYSGDDCIVRGLARCHQRLRKERVVGA